MEDAILRAGDEAAIKALAKVRGVDECVERAEFLDELQEV